MQKKFETWVDDTGVRRGKKHGKQGIIISFCEYIGCVKVNEGRFRLMGSVKLIIMPSKEQVAVFLTIS